MSKAEKLTDMQWAIANSLEALEELIKKYEAVGFKKDGEVITNEQGYAQLLFREREVIRI